MTRSECPFCSIVATEAFDQSNDLAVAFRDKYPVSPGHTLAIPRRHEPDYFSLRREEQLAMHDLLLEAAEDLKLEADAFNLGLNSGPAAGQTVPHAHLHLIPRVDGDVPDPRGGIRWVVPDRAKYWN